MYHWGSCLPETRAESLCLPADVGPSFKGQERDELEGKLALPGEALAQRSESVLLQHRSQEGLQRESSTGCGLCKAPAQEKGLR